MVGHLEPWGLRPRLRWARFLLPLLVALLATQLLVAAPLSRAAEAPTPAYIELDGRRVLEIRFAAGAQTPAQVAGRASQRLAELAANYSIQPEQIVLQEDPPYTTIGVMREGKFEPRLSVDDRNAARFQLSRQQLAQRYLEQIRAAIVRYRQTHRRSDWLRGAPWPCSPWVSTSCGCEARSPLTGAWSAGSTIPPMAGSGGCRWGGTSG